VNLTLRLILAGFLSIGITLGNAAEEKDKKGKAKTEEKKTDATFKNTLDKVSYSIGVDIGSSFKRQSLEVNPEFLASGIKDALAGKALLTEQEVRNTLMAYQQELQAKQGEIRKQQAEKNKKEGDAFLAENKKKKGVKTLPSGLQYKVIKEGKGKSPQPTDAVVAHYQGTLIDGTEFDSSYKRGQPATFPVSGVIPGWTEALQLMKEGSKWQLFIPPHLAYGEQGNPRIPPNSTLIFEVELISVQSAAKQDQGALR